MGEKTSIPDQVSVCHCRLSPQEEQPCELERHRQESEN